MRGGRKKNNIYLLPIPPPLPSHLLKTIYLPHIAVVVESLDLAGVDYLPFERAVLHSLCYDVTTIEDATVNDAS